MFLSVIAPCYNCKNTINRVLNSILIQEFTDLEVIIIDDNSPESFIQILNKYKELLDIKYFKINPKIHCPGNSRKVGLEKAQGDWVTFIDHDDAFKEGAFKLFYDTVKSSEKPYHFFFSPVEQVDENGNNKKQLDAITWLHGNFYERKWLLDNNINFKQDLKGNEDLYFNNLVYNTLLGEDESYWTSQVPLYKWYSISKSLSNSLTEDSDCGYTEKYFKDYLIANVEPAKISIGKFPNKLDNYKSSLFRVIIYSYFYYQRAIYLFKDEKVLSDMLKSIKDFFNEYKRLFNNSTEDIINEIYKNSENYNSLRDIIKSLSGNFIEKQSIKEFYNG